MSYEDRVQASIESTLQLEGRIKAFYADALGKNLDRKKALAVTAIKFDMHWATIKMVVGA